LIKPKLTIKHLPDLKPPFDFFVGRFKEKPDRYNADIKPKNLDAKPWLLGS